MPSRSRKLLTAVVLSIDGGPPDDACPKSVDAAIRGLADGLHQHVHLSRFSGVMSFARPERHIVVELLDPETPVFEPLRVSPAEAKEIAYVYLKLGELHEGFSWREVEVDDQPPPGTAKDTHPSTT